MIDLGARSRLTLTTKLGYGFGGRAVQWTP
jgi:hypothetical protein